MPRIIIFSLLLTFLVFVFPVNVLAQNNKVGVHILDPSEIHKAAGIINHGGDWGYVTIPIRATDRDRAKWQKFMDDARNLHIIPLVRLASVPYQNYWRKPTLDEIIDFSNFLSDLNWPTKTKHVIIFNEPNHSYEWGGTVNPVEYGGMLEFAVDRFKSIDSNFFILPAAMDAAAPNSPTSMSNLRYLEIMFNAHPNLAPKLDALNSHSYPNPAFSGKPTESHKSSIASYKYELNLLKKYTSKKLPVFITETGWQMDSLSQQIVADFFTQAFNSVWSDEQVRAVTPFLLEAGRGEFEKFSLINSDGSLTSLAISLKELTKAKGEPELEPAFAQNKATTSFASGKSPDNKANSLFISQITNKTLSIWANIRRIIYKLRGVSTITIGNILIEVEVADSDKERSQGLSNRSTLKPNSGMLFVFPNASIYTFWMKDMQFPLDFIWIKNDKVVQVDQGILPPRPNEPPALIRPNVEVDKVLEVNSGFIQNHGIKVGDSVQYN